MQHFLNYFPLFNIIIKFV